MRLTEEEAKTKHCCGPFAPKKCLGTDCMAWRWVDDDDRADNAYGYCGLAHDVDLHGISMRTSIEGLQATIEGLPGWKEAAP